VTIASQLLTADDLLRMPDDGWRHELVQGELRRMPPPGYQHGRTASRIGVSLSVHVDGHDLGVVLAAETGFLLSSNPDEVRAADVSFVSNERLAAAQFQREKYFPGAPDLLFEVLSPSDTYTAVQEKVLLWLRSGARVVVLVDTERHLFVVHKPHSEPEILVFSDSFAAEEVIPGWSLPVSDAFPEK
jgi:Uma2 family endonuclease